LCTSCTYVLDIKSIFRELGISSEVYEEFETANPRSEDVSVT
jgi:hypothetical protein